MLAWRGACAERPGRRTRPRRDPSASAAGATTAPALPRRDDRAGDGQAGGGSRVALPTYVAPKGPAPDVPGTDIIPPGFVTLSEESDAVRRGPPGDGGEVTVAGEVFTTLVPYDNNTLWQQLNKR